MFEVLLNHQALETLGTTNVIVDEICGEGTWAEYVARCQRWKDSQAKKEALIFEKRRKEKEDRKKKFEEQIEMWKSGKILELYSHYYLEDDQPNVWLRIKNGIIETSKNIKIGRAEAERLWKLIKLFHNGGKFQHDMALDITGHKWKINSYKNDIGETSKMSWAALPVGPACIGKTCGGKRGVRSCSLDWLGRQIIYKHIRRYEY